MGVVTGRGAREWGVRRDGLGQITGEATSVVERVRRCRAQSERSRRRRRARSERTSGLGTSPCQRDPARRSDFGRGGDGRDDQSFELPRRAVRGARKEWGRFGGAWRADHFGGERVKRTSGGRGNENGPSWVTGSSRVEGVSGTSCCGGTL